MWNKIDKITGFVLAVAFLALAGHSIAGHTRQADVKIIRNKEVPKIRVEVTGAVKNPGEYVLDKGSRVCDLLYAAGGVCEDADTDILKLDALLVSDTDISVPHISDDLQGPVPVININTADKEEIMLIPGVGDYLAENIINYRKENGAFKDVSDIKSVKGIGDKTFENIKIYITVDDKE